ncbi:hypothetical protein AK830_g7357 [Neonectria ditissima]|uniref:Uncharacterized protein n=1 Tax=Neonectria ditissima TaxID=78410 RepID=A0A0P7BF52_9HYPO|nr:hypothetical protein AK830_g7357 [Neonectria ditissima]
MGQRHQLFVIARLGNHYRPLAAIHHQWLYGVSALRSCRRLLRIFSDASNRTALKHELHLAAGFFKDRGPPPAQPPEYEDPEKQPCLFPFITTCLAVGTGYDGDLGRVHTVHELAYDTGFDQGDNNDGITVIDISDLDDVRYCFVNVFENDYDSDAAPSPGVCTPLTGRQYVGGYYNESDDMWQANVHIIEALDKAPLVEVGALAGTWPWGDWTIEDIAAQSEELADQTGTRNSTKSLRDLAATTLFSRLLQSTDDEFDPSLLDEVRDLPRFQRILKEHLLSHPTTVSPVGATKASAFLLQLAYAGETCLEWNVFENLTSKVIDAALSYDALKSVTTICLSPPLHDSPAEFVKALTPLASLHTLQILDWPVRKDERISTEIFEAIVGSSQPTSIKKLTLSGLYANGIRQKIWRPYQQNPRISEAYPVVQLLVAHEGRDNKSVLPSGGKLEYFYLGDAALSPARAILGFFEYIVTQILGSSRYNGTGLDTAHCFSCGPSALGNADSLEISPLPAEVYTVAKAGYHSSAFSGVYSKMRDLIPGTWTVVVSESRSTAFADHIRTTQLQFKYAFVRPKVSIQVDPEHWRGADIESSEIDVVDLEGFLRLAVPDVDTSKLKFHFDNVEAAVAKAKDDGDIIIVQKDTILSPFSHDQACDLLNQFITEVPEIQKTAKRAANWGGIEDHWLSKLGYNLDKDP